jgi:hypothetical protein
MRGIDRNDQLWFRFPARHPRATARSVLLEGDENGDDVRDQQADGGDSRADANHPGASRDTLVSIAAEEYAMRTGEQGAVSREEVIDLIDAKE